MLPVRVPCGACVDSVTNWGYASLARSPVRGDLRRAMVAVLSLRWDGAGAVVLSAKQSGRPG